MRFLFMKFCASNNNNTTIKGARKLRRHNLLGFPITITVLLAPERIALRFSNRLNPILPNSRQLSSSNSFQRCSGWHQYHPSNKMSTTSGNGNNDEVAAAIAAAGSNNVDTGKPTVFDKILSGEWSCNKVYEDDLCLAFHDINPQGPVHVVIIPKKRDGLTMLSRARQDQKDILGHLLFIAGTEVGSKLCPEGFRIVINDGMHGSQSVYHLHVHVIGKYMLS
jgi:histidine triad (HIT) family protein